MLLIPIVLFGVLAVNFVISSVLNDGKSINRIVSFIIYIYSFLTLLLMVIHTNSKNRNLYLLLLMTIFPCFYVGDITGGLGRKFDPIGSSSGYFYAISGFLWSIAGLFNTLKLLIFDNLNLLLRIKTQNTLLVFQAYSVLFTISIYLALLKTRTIYKKSLLLYSKFKYFILICAVFSVCYVLFFGKNTLISYSENTDMWYKTLFFLLLYISLLIIYIIAQKRYEIWGNELIAVIFILLFPIISVSSNTFNLITADTIPNYERCIGISPLLSALPNTIKYLINDLYFQEKYVFSIKLYSLFQIFMILYVFPSILIPKINRNG